MYGASDPKLGIPGIDGAGTPRSLCERMVAHRARRGQAPALLALLVAFIEDRLGGKISLPSPRYGLRDHFTDAHRLEDKRRRPVPASASSSASFEVAPMSVRHEGWWRERHRSGGIWLIRTSTAPAPTRCAPQESGRYQGCAHEPKWRSPDCSSRRVATRSAGLPVGHSRQTVTPAAEHTEGRCLSLRVSASPAATSTGLWWWLGD